MSAPIRLGLVGFGKIARDQHLPSIAATPGIELVASASRHDHAPGLPAYPSIEAMLAGEPDMDAVALCQPPQARYDAARAALLAGKHVFLEKPPGASVSEVQALVELARARGVTLYASWHSRHASGVAAARDWIAGRVLDSVRITWKEDVRQWHPGQTWIWQAGGFGVFDPGINALSILTAILPDPVRLIEAALEVPANCQAPIAARLTMASAGGTPISAEFDFRQTGLQTWDIAVHSGTSLLRLGCGGNHLEIDGTVVPAGPDGETLAGEYPAMYRDFVSLIRAGASAVDLAPLQLVADAFLRGQTMVTDEFHE